jgi:hypothetical protein
MFDDELGLSIHWWSSLFVYVHHLEFTFIEAENGQEWQLTFFILSCKDPNFLQV